MANFSGSDHPIFRASSAFERGELRSKGGGKKSIHFNGSHENIELLLRKLISANQISIYGAIADLCNEILKDLEGSGETAAPDHLEKMEIPTDLSIAENSTNAQQRGNLVQEYERKFEQLSEDQKLSKLCSDAGLKLVEQTILPYSRYRRKGRRCKIYAESTRCLQTRRRLVRKDGFSRTRGSAQS